MEYYINSIIQLQKTLILKWITNENNHLWIKKEWKIKKNERMSFKIYQLSHEIIDSGL